MTHDTQSTPITAEGLRGLGMELGDGKNEWFSLRTPENSLEVIRYRHTADWRVYTGGGYIGTAPDLETVGRLIEVLRRMNGGGA